MNRTHCMALAILLLVFSQAETAHALDGRIQISSPGTVISQSGSYVLTQNLVVPAATTAITVTADYVTIDLNGFTISGPVTCTYLGPGASCVGGGGEIGIAGSASEGLVVVNGFLRGLSGTGISGGVGSRVENVAFREIDGDAVDLAGESVVLRSSFRTLDGNAVECTSACIIAENNILEITGDALQTDFGRSIFRDNSIRTVDGHGIDTNPIGSPRGGLAYRNAISDGKSGGIFFWGPGVAIENTVVSSGATGISMSGSHSLVTGNTVTAGTSFGVSVARHSLILGNAIRDNAGVGINASGILSPTVACGSNTLSGNSGGTEFSGCVELGQNLCGGSLTCP